MRKFTVRRFFSVYLRRKSRSKSSSLGRLEVTAGAPGGLRVPPRPAGLRLRALPPCALSHARCPQRCQGAKVTGEPVPFP